LVQNLKKLDLFVFEITRGHFWGHLIITRNLFSELMFQKLTSLTTPSSIIY